MSSFHDNPNQTRNQKSIQHLKSIKPFDGWSIDTFNDNKSNNANNNNTTTKKNDDELVMLKRRNIPLYNKQGFEFIYYDEDNTKCVYGITSYIGDTHDSLFCKAVVLVDEKGIVVRDLDQKNHISIKVKKNEGTKDVTMDMRKKNILRAKEGLKRRQNTTGSPTNQSSNTVIPNMSDEQTAEMARLGLIFIGGLTMLKMFATMFKSLNIVLFPLLVLYAMSTCPSNDSFDAKKELKRVMRGHHLPQNHPDKPKDDWFSSTIARVTASVATELATSLGYELSFFNVAGVCNIVTVVVPVTNQEFYWIGIFGTWRYLLRREKPKSE